MTAEECEYCGERCFDGEGCDEHNADGFEDSELDRLMAIRESKEALAEMDFNRRWG